MGMDSSGILIEIMCPPAAESHVVEFFSKWGFYWTNRTPHFADFTFNMEYGAVQACVCMSL